MKLEDKRWKAFDFEDIFKIVGGYYNKKPVISSDEQLIPFLGATMYNNGVTDFISKLDIEKYDRVGLLNSKDKNNRVFPANCIAVSNNGSSIGDAYYQAFEFTCSHDITVLYGKDIEISKNIALFLIPLIKNSGKKYVYANKWRPIRMKRSKIMLPINDTNKPDYLFMEKYIEQVLNYKSKIISLPESENISLSKTASWSSFKLGEISKIYGGKDLPRYNRTKGDIPFIGSSSVRNGVTDFIDIKDSKYVAKNMIGINRNGSVGYAFYHPYKAYFSGDTRFIKLNEYSDNKYVNLFITTSIMKQKDKYAFGYKMGTNRIANQPIILPVTSTGNINYAYMEAFMKKKEHEAYEKIRQ